jgi:hypothetical protein
MQRLLGRGEGRAKLGEERGDDAMMEIKALARDTEIDE